MGDISEEVNRFKHHTEKSGAEDESAGEDRFAWWNEARFGWFTSWGLFSLLERGEWVMHRERIPKAEYARLADRFNPTKFDADRWVALAQEAGMKYMYFMPRHHDGFCMWDTKTTDYSSVQQLAGRDFIAESVEACRKAGMRVGFYYSVMDWRWPAFWLGPEDSIEKWAELRDFVHEQVRELMTNYGDIDLIWWDAKIPHSDDAWRWRELIAMIRGLQPGVIMNGEDFDSSEGDVMGSKRPWEASITIDDIWWGYHAGDPNLKSARQLIRHLVHCVVGIGGSSGHLTINISPKGDGSIPKYQVKRLKSIGKWMNSNGDSIYGAGSTPYWPLHLGWGATGKGSRIYVHVMFWPGRELCVGGIKNRVLGASLLATGKKLPFEQNADRLFVRGLPSRAPDPIDTVVALDLEGEPESIPETFWK